MTGYRRCRPERAVPASLRTPLNSNRLAHPILSRRSPAHPSAWKQAESSRPSDPQRTEATPVRRRGSCIRGRRHLRLIKQPVEDSAPKRVPRKNSPATLPHSAPGAGSPATKVKPGCHKQLPHPHTSSRCPIKHQSLNCRTATRQPHEMAAHA